MPCYIIILIENTTKNDHQNYQMDSKEQRVVKLKHCNWKVFKNKLYHSKHDEICTIIQLENK